MSIGRTSSNSNLTHRIVFFILIERFEFDVFRFQSFVGKWSLKRVKIVGTNRYQRSEGGEGITVVRTQKMGQPIVKFEKSSPIDEGWDGRKKSELGT